MAKETRMRSCYRLSLLASVALNIFFATSLYSSGIELWRKQKQKLSWTQKAAAEAEAVASISCSGHGRAYLDGLLGVDGKPMCECNGCYGASDCSVFLPDCAADANSGDPLFLEPFWMKHAESSAVLVSGWHRMSYVFNDQSYMSQELEDYIRRLHAVARNAVTKGKYMVFGVGSTQLLSAAVYALSMNFSTKATVVAVPPAYSLYEHQTDFFENSHFAFSEDTTFLNKSDYNGANVIEIVTSPNNPDGNFRKAVFQGPMGKTIHDHAYYWPHYTAIPAPLDEDVMIFTMSKLTGHAGTRFGWALVKDEKVYERMKAYILVAEQGTSREPQLKALQLMKTILHGNGTEIFEFAYNQMRDRWERLARIVSQSSRFTLQKIPSQFCNFLEKVRGPSPAYAWLKCEREEDNNCCGVLEAANIIGRPGNRFSVEDRYVRLSLLKADDDFNLLLHRLSKLVAQEKDGLVASI